MKLRDLIEHLQKNYDPDATVYVGDYYYDAKMGYTTSANFNWIGTNDIYHQPSEENVILFDTHQGVAQ